MSSNERPSSSLRMQPQLTMMLLHSSCTLPLLLLIDQPLQPHNMNTHLITTLPLELHHTTTTVLISIGLYQKVTVLLECFVTVRHVGTPPMSDTTKMIVDELYQDRLETLLSVDDLVEEVVGTLEVELTTVSVAIIMFAVRRSAG